MVLASVCGKREEKKNKKCVCIERDKVVTYEQGVVQGGCRVQEEEVKFLEIYSGCIGVCLAPQWVRKIKIEGFAKNKGKEIKNLKIWREEEEEKKEK